MQLSRPAQLPSFPASVCFCVSSLPLSSSFCFVPEPHRLFPALNSSPFPLHRTCVLAPSGRATVGCTSTLQDNHFPVGLLVCSLQQLPPLSTPPRSSLRVDTLLAGRSLLFAGPRLVASCRSCRLFQGGLVTPNCYLSTTLPASARFCGLLAWSHLPPSMLATPPPIYIQRTRALGHVSASCRYTRSISAIWS
ncbi:hypothetical protein GQ42DRAFT_16846 [Ramicandelaber brevisporus]|nr:hypothetical protein GQ42DRAFT_16846 [Ramicandelaber brevisporus]